MGFGGIRRTQAEQALHSGFVRGLCIRSQAEEAASAAAGVAAKTPASKVEAKNSNRAVTLVDEAEQSSRKKRRRLQTQTTNEIVARKLYDNFRTASSEVTDCIKVQGQTLRERIRNDIYKARADPNFKMGSGYYKELKALYMQSAAAADALQVVDKALPVCPKLMAAIGAYQSSQKNSAPLVSWLEIATGANQKEVVGLLRLGLRLEPSLSLKQAQVVASIGKFMVRCKVHKSCRKEYEAFRPHIDASLCMLYAHAKKEHVTLGVFVALHRDLCHLLAGQGDIETVLACSSAGSWADVADELMRITSGSIWGMKALGFARLLVQGATLGRVLDEEIEELARSDMTVDRVQALRMKMMTMVEELDVGGVLRSQKRTVDLQYLGIPLVVTVSDPTEEVRMRIGCQVKMHAAGRGLTNLFGEAAFVTPLTDFVSVDPSLYADTQAARDLIDGVLRNSDVESGEYMRELVHKKSVVLLSLDPTFKVELAVFAWICGAGGSSAVHQRVLGILPDASRSAALTAAQTQLHTLRQSEMAKCVLRATQTELQMVSETLDLMLAGKPVKEATLRHSDFMKAVGAQLHWFAEFEVDGRKLRGRDAVQARYDMVAKTPPEDRMLNMLADLHTYKHLLTAEQDAEVASWTKEVLTKLKVVDGGDGQGLGGGTPAAPSSAVTDLFS